MLLALGANLRAEGMRMLTKFKGIKRLLGIYYLGFETRVQEVLILIVSGVSLAFAFLLSSC